MPRFIAVVAVLALIILLITRFPYVLQDEYGRMRALYLVLVLLIGAMFGARWLRHHSTPRALRDAVIWVGIVLLLVLAYSFKEEVSHSRLMAELMPQQVRIMGNGTMEIRVSEGGHFFLEGEVNRVKVRFLVDTGASDVVLSQDDAARAGFMPGTLDYSRSYVTANGYGKGAPVTLRTLRIGNVVLSGMRASVNQAPMGESLLGMSFLRQLSGFRVEGAQLILIP